MKRLSKELFICEVVYGVLVSKIEGEKVVETAIQKAKGHRSYFKGSWKREISKENLMSRKSGMVMVRMCRSSVRGPAY